MNTLDAGKRLVEGDHIEWFSSLSLPVHLHDINIGIYMIRDTYSHTDKDADKAINIDKAINS